jgi:hypothetical protein
MTSAKPVRELQVDFKVPYVYDYKIKLFRTQTEVILNHVNPNVRGIGEGEAMKRKYMRFQHGGGQAYYLSAS